MIRSQMLQSRLRIARYLQVKQQDQVLQQLQHELKAEQQRHQDTLRQIQLNKKSIVELQDEIDVHQKRERDAACRLREAETSAGRMREESEMAQQRARTLRDELAEKDGQLRVARMTLDTVQKQNQQQLVQVNSYIYLGVE